MGVMAGVCVGEPEQGCLAAVLLGGVDVGKTLEER